MVSANDMSRERPLVIPYRSSRLNEHKLERCYYASIAMARSRCSDGPDDSIRMRGKRYKRCMADTKTLLAQAYAAFNRRDTDAALALMTEDVSWPKASEGGKVVGKEEIRAYWTRQWGEFDPHVEPIAITEESGGKIRVRVHQLVKSLGGDVLSDSEVLHVFTVESGLIAAMDLGTEAEASAGPSAAFAHRS